MDIASPVPPAYPSPLTYRDRVLAPLSLGPAALFVVRALCVGRRWSVDAETHRCKTLLSADELGGE
jgi:hypothetical protein